MLDTLRFIQGAVSTKDIVPVLSHYYLKDGIALSSNGKMSLCAPMPDAPNCCPKATEFYKAIQRCDEAPVLAVTPTGRISVKSGKFRALIDAESTDNFPTEAPEGVRYELSAPLLPTIARLMPYVSEDTSRAWSVGMHFAGGKIFATNNVIVAEMDCPFPTEHAVVIPYYALREMLRIGEEPIAVQVADNSMSLHYAGGRWLKTRLLDGGWPDIAALLDGLGASSTPLPDGLQTALDKLEPFVGINGAIFFHDGVVSTAREDGCSYELGADLSACYNLRMLQSILDAETADLQRHPAPAPFGKQGMRGAIIGMRL
jgi:DNA polymerase III sliding clamp (beta) subunit (PCNA family)